MTEYVCEIRTLKLKSSNFDLMSRWEWPFAVPKFLYTLRMYSYVSDKPANGVNSNQTEFFLNKNLNEMAIGWSISSIILNLNCIYADPSVANNVKWSHGYGWRIFDYSFFWALLSFLYVQLLYLQFKVNQIQIQYDTINTLDEIMQTRNMQQDIVMPRIRYTLPNWKAIKTYVIEVLCDCFSFC